MRTKNSFETRNDTNQDSRSSRASSSASVIRVLALCVSLEGTEAAAHFRCVMRQVILVLALFSTSLPGFAQKLTISNPQHIPLPEQRVRLVFQYACQAAEERFNLQDTDKFHLLLVMDKDAPEKYVADEEQNRFAIYLKQWNEPLFTVYTMRLEIQKLIMSRRLRDQLLLSVMKRVDSIAPIDARALQE